MIQSNLAARPAVKNIFRQFVESLEYIHLHSLTNRVLPLNVRHGSAADCEVLGDHTEVIVPALVVAHRLSLQMFEGESCDVVGKFVLGEDFRRNFLCVVLILNIAHNHAMQDVIGLARVRVRFRKLAISERIVAVVKFSDVSPKVLRNDEFPARMNSFIAICAKDQIIADNQRITRLHSLLNLSRTVCRQLLLFD